MKVSEALKHLQKHYNPEDAICQIIWSVEDVQGVAKEEDTVLSTEQCENILQTMEHHHDCEYGITWETIKSQVEEFK
jgi:hypothetical protein